ncbi:ATP-binding cassette domain-containing protein [Luteococcus peritonei]|uniref:ATP-binding cassette domain-containing protein n=1 Tax=Luteococcus peritonei TaxID=88874 RepID=A0ABW4RVE5_9ACTN
MDEQHGEISEAPRHVETADVDAPPKPHAPEHALGEDEVSPSAAHAPSHALPGDEPEPTVDLPRHGAGPLADDMFREPSPDTLPQAEATEDTRAALLQARGLELAGRQNMVFGPLDLELRPDQVGVVTGQQGSGRSALLLALAGRLKGVQGSLIVGDIDGIAHPRALRKQVSLARITDFAELEPNLTVGESRDERAIAEGIGTRRGRERFRHLEDLLDHRFQLDQWVDRLPAVEKTLLVLVLGCLKPASLVVCDDLDDSLTDAQLRWIHDGIAVLREDGNHFFVSMLDESPLPDDARVVHLVPPPSRDADFLPNHPIRRHLATRKDV